MHRFKKIALRTLLALIILYCLLLIPDSKQKLPTQPAGKPFAWNQDSMWHALEKTFSDAKQAPGQTIDSSIKMLLTQQQSLHQYISSKQISEADTSLKQLLQNYFRLAPLVAAMPHYRDSFIHIYNSNRNEVKQQSQHWNMNSAAVRNTIYELLYGMRAAAEEVLLQTADKPFEAAINVKYEAASSPYTTIFGIAVHSGDLLVSRGGAEVSALISRGNNYPGNFSHVAMIYVDEKSTPYLIEAHIEKGVAISSAEQYIKDKKLRFMVLRPRADLPALKADPLLPHKAAKYAYDEAMKRHIPYDFKMNFYDSTALFCSEVASYAYRKQGVQLWQALSTISSQGVVNWLSDFGVENFVTQMPSDLEYDSQLSVVAEWRNPETLMKDHIDNAVMDVLLEEADKGKQITYAHWQLPFVRIIKLWCIIQNAFGKPGIIPEGMNATRALKNQTFVAMYNNLREKTRESVSVFFAEKHYQPPYWQIISLARSAQNTN